MRRVNSKKSAEEKWEQFRKEKNGDINGTYFYQL